MPSYIDYLLPKKLRNRGYCDRLERARYGRLEGWVSIGANTLLFITKLMVGLIVNSLSIVADAFHSFSDVLTSVVVLVGYTLSEKPGDREHPYGHQRIEYVATLIIAILLAVVGFEFIRQGYQRIIHPEPVKFNWLILVFILATIVLKYMLGDYSRRIGQLINSAALKADAFHHYSDSASSVLVLLAVIGSGLGYPFWDGVAGVLVGAILIYGGFKLAKDAADTLIGQPPSPEVVARIRHICRTVPQVIDAHDIIVHTYGDKLFISVHIEIDQQKSSLQAHAISDAVEAMLVKELNALATIHLDPVDTKSEVLKDIKAYLDTIIADYPAIKEYHDLRIVAKPGHQLILFDLVPVASSSKASLPENVREKLKSRLTERFPDYDIEISFDPIYIYN